MRFSKATINRPLEQFVEYYYKAFDGNRQELAGLYGNDSMLTFEAAPHQGVAAIVDKLQVRQHTIEESTSEEELWLTTRAEPPLQKRPAPSQHPRRATLGRTRWNLSRCVRRVVGGRRVPADELHADISAEAEGGKLLRV